MTNDNNTKMMETMASLQQQEEDQKSFLRELLHKFSNKRGYFFAQKVKMGYLDNELNNKKQITSYIAKHGLRYVAKNVKMGSDMPFMKDHRDPKTGKITVTTENIDDLKQRAPDWSRQVQLTAYLIRNPNHKFTTILAVVQPEWFTDLNHENWGEDGRALKDAIEFESLDDEGNIGLLNLESSIIYALDGQHRIMGIRGLADLEANKFVQKNKRDTKPIETFTLESFFDRLGGSSSNDHSIVQKVLSEDISIEYIPAIVKGETLNEARRRTRNIFVSLNTNAKKPTKGELYLLNEEEGHVIVSNKVATTHPIFKGGERVNMTDTTLSAKVSTDYATLESIAQTARNILVEHNLARYNRWYPKFKDLPGLRPNDEQLNEATVELNKFYSLMHKMPVFETLEQNENKRFVITLRAFPKRDKKIKIDDINWKDVESNEHKGHLMLRPIGPQILADAVGELIYKDHATMEEVFDKIYKMDRDNMFSAHLPKSIFYGVTYNPDKDNMDTNKQKLASELIKYLIKGSTTKELPNLMSAVISGRTIDSESGKWVNFSGKVVDIASETETSPTKLPKPYN